MQFQRTKLGTALLCAFGSGLFGLLPSAQAEEPQRIEITGSAIKRVEGEGPSPVEIITRKDIARTGATSVNELLRSIPSIDIYDQGELTSNSPSGSGTASIAMRGLSESETLILLNGRRMPVNALYDSSGAGAAFDINSLPIGAIERIEILKEGASALYGADAIAGVINFITKNDYQGIELTASTGISSRGDGAEQRFGMSAGFGDFGKDGFNVLFGLDYFKRDPIYRKDREISKSVDFRRLGATRDGRSGFSPYGNIIDPITGDFVGQSYRTCPAENLNNGVCRYDFNSSLLTAYNGADRLSALVVGNVAITPDIKAFAEAVFSTSKDTFKAHPVPDYFIVPITDESQRPYEILDGDGNGTDSIYITGRFMQGGPRTTKRKSDFYNTTLGLEGATAGLDWKVSLSRGQSKVKNSDSNYFDGNKWLEATSNGSIDPTVLTNDQALVDSLKVKPTRLGKSTLTSFNGLVSGEFFKLPGGVAKYATGVAFNTEKLVDTPDALTQQGLVVGSIQQAAVDASRNFSAVFGELDLPVTKELEAQLALRYDHYPKWSSTSPLVGLKYTFAPELALRTSFARSFRAPVLKQLYGAQEEGASTITDPAQCVALGATSSLEDDCSLSVNKVGGSNANLTPEKGKTLNIGMVFELAKSLNASIDWWKISKTNEIAEPSMGTAIEQGFFEKIGPKYYVYTTLQNIAEHQVSGIDLDLRYLAGNTPIGKLSLRNAFTWYTSDKQKDDPSATSWYSYLGTYATPRFRNTFTVTTELDSFTVTSALRSVGGFYDSDATYDEAKSARRVSSHTEVDLQGQYSGFAGWDLTLGIKNLFDSGVPLSLTNGTDNTYSQQGFAELYSSRGRFFYLGAKYAFR